MNNYLSKEIFFTIPGFSKYEINGFLVVRNKHTQRVLNNQVSGQFVALTDDNGRHTLRSPRVLYRNARPDTEEWRVIPSFPNYEISERGNVRHVRTKLLKQLINNRYDLGGGKRRVHYTRTKASLLNEVYGVPMTSRQHRRSCTLQRNGRRIFFDTLTDAARFLMKDNFFSLFTFRSWFRQRRPIICGWSVTYLDCDNVQKPTLISLSKQAQRQKRADKDAFKEVSA